MREYQYLVTIQEGSDEWWEDLANMSEKERINEIRLVLEEELYAYGAVLENRTVYQEEIQLKLQLDG
jgi:hypothetical protein